MNGRCFIVTCSDGHRRHDHPFGSYADAARWAEWGHCCASEHSITTVVSKRKVSA